MKRMIAIIAAIATALALCLALAACGSDPQPLELKGATIAPVEGWSTDAQNGDISAEFKLEGHDSGYVKIFCSSNTESAAEWGQIYINNYGGQAVVSTMTIGDQEWVCVTPNGIDDQVILIADRTDQERSVVTVNAMFYTLDEAMPLFEAITVL
ncbi:MAG: hypothetical protein K6G78_02895 [bacterium]|nr:hypothetical protein [bacterium]